jgi:hypothetical protein
MLASTKIGVGKENQLELQHCGTVPVRLANVRKKKSPTRLASLRSRMWGRPDA